MPSNATPLCIITGASRGIGKALAQYMAQHGYRVIGTATSSQGAQRISSWGTDSSADSPDPTRLPSRIQGYVLDVRDAASTQAVMDSIMCEHGPVSVLINNAGIVNDQLVVRMKQEAWDQVIDVNLSAVFRVSRCVLGSMLKQRYGRIIQISSVIAHMANPGQSNYAAAKAGLGGLTRSLAMEVASRNITVNMVAPGYIDTEMTQTISEKHRDAIAARIPAGRFGSMDEVAAAVLFLCSEQAGYITGTTLHVNGGLYM